MECGRQHQIEFCLDYYIMYAFCLYADETKKVSDGTIKETNRERLVELHEKLLENLDIKFLLPGLYAKSKLVCFVVYIAENRQFGSKVINGFLMLVS